MRKNEVYAEYRGGPGLVGYAYKADTYCEDCNWDVLKRAVETAEVKALEGINDPCFYDSETLPQPIFFGESGDPVHCSDCGEYLYGGDTDD